MPARRWMPVPESPIWALVQVGGPSSEPVVLMEPPMAWADGLVGLAVDERTGTESLDRRVDDAGVDFADDLPGESLAIQSAGAEVLHHQVTDPRSAWRRLPCPSRSWC